MMLFVALSSAFAGGPGYQACCAAAGVPGCPADLAVVGPGTTLAPEASATRATGIWTVSCDAGARFDPAASQLVTARPGDGQVITPLAQAGAACYEAACRLPAALCIRHEGDKARIVACTGAAADLALWQTSPVEDTRAAVVDKRVLVVRDAVGSSPPPFRAPPTNTSTTTTTSTSTSASTTTGPGAMSSTVNGLPPPSSTVAPDLTIPEAPALPCRASAQRTESQAQVDDGNAAAMKGDYAYALQRYRAAIALNSCNAFAWADMGETFLALHDAGRARTALTTATSMMPGHYTAWTNLGKSQEILGDLLAAADAYGKALEQKPGFAPATEGLARVKPR